MPPLTTNICATAGRSAVYQVGSNLEPIETGRLVLS